MGYASVDNAGLAGVERYFDQQLQSGETVQLSIDLRLQRMVEQRDRRARSQKFSAIGATAIVMDVTNGEVLAMASLPTYDPNKTKTITNEALFNRATLGVYEQGSTFKIFNTAMALDSGKVTLTSVFDATSPIKIDRFTINDDHAAAPAADGAGDLHVLVQHRLGQDGGRAWARRPSAPSSTRSAS